MASWCWHNVRERQFGKRDRKHTPAFIKRDFPFAPPLSSSSPDYIVINNHKYSNVKRNVSKECPAACATAFQLRDRDGAVFELE